MRKQVMLPLFYQIIEWFLYYVCVYVLPDFFGDDFGDKYGTLWFALCCFFVAVSPLVYYLVSIKLFRTRTEEVLDYVIQIGCSIFFDIVITVFVLGLLVDSSYFAGVMEILFAVLNVVAFVYASINVAIMKVIGNHISARAGHIYILAHIICYILLPILLIFVPHNLTGKNDLSEYEQKKQQEQQLLNDMLEAKDAEITYDAYTISSQGILNTQYQCPTLFIDYDTHTVGFLDNSDLDSYNQFQLKKTLGATSGYHVQAQWKLDSPGERITTYYLNEENSHRTVALRLDMKDGSTYELGKMEESDGGAFLGIPRPVD